MMTIKAFEAATGVKRTTIRFYEMQGLLKPEGFARNGAYRVYCQAQVERVHMIRMAQTLGFSLKEIAALMKAWESKRMSPASQRAVIAERLDAVRGKQVQLDQLRNYLESILRWMDEGRHGPKPALQDRAPHGRTEAA